MLRDTYSQPKIHEDWRNVYGSNAAQLAADSAIYDYLFRKLQPAGSWVDAGCGSGERTVQLARRCPSVVAVDISEYVLENAKKLVDSAGLLNKVKFQCSPLEHLAVEGAMNVHCRGVLMHIPDWRKCLINLCRVVGPGGYLVIFEGNCHSLEALIVKIVRVFKKTSSRLVSTEGGLEFWSEVGGNPFVVRMADGGAITKEITAQGLDVVLRIPMELFDINRFPHLLRRSVVWFNDLWFKLGLPFAFGTIIVARKKPQ